MRSASVCLFLLVIAASPATATVPWPTGDWSHRTLVTIDPALIEDGETYTDFNVLVRLDGVQHPDIFAFARSDGADLLFTGPDGVTECPREVVTFDSQAATAEIWVKLDHLSDFENTFYVYFGASSTTLDPLGVGTWGDEYRVVYHFEEDPADLFLSDSSPQGAHAVLDGGVGWTSADVESGPIGQSWKYNGTTHYTATRAISTPDSSYSIGAWLEHLDGSTDFFFQAQPGYWALSSKISSSQSAGYLGSYDVRWTPAPIQLDDGYHHFLWVFDGVGDEVNFYFDGVLQTPNSIFPPPTGPLYTGRPINPDRNELSGIVGPMYYVIEDLHMGGADEFRVRNGVPSDGRVLTEYRNQSDPGSFLLFGDTESRGVTAALPLESRLSLRSSPNPSSGPQFMEYVMPEAGSVRIAVYDFAGRRVATVEDTDRPAGRWTAQWNGLDDEGRELAASVYFMRLETVGGVRTQKISLVR